MCVCVCVCTNIASRTPFAMELSLIQCCPEKSERGSTVDVCVCLFAGKAAEDVLMTACTQKSAWDSFTKPQRKSINLWKESAGVRVYNYCF